MKADDAWVALSNVKDGTSETRYDRRYPSWTSSGAIAFSAADGEVTGPIEVSVVAQKVSTLENSADLGAMMAAMGRPSTTLRLFSFDLWVTDARIVSVQTKPVTPGVRIAGHLRYPWISGIQYHPKQSFLMESILQLSFVEEFPIASLGTWFHTLELTFHKSFDPGPLALDIAHRLARHHLAHGAEPEMIERLKYLSEAEAVPSPRKGDMGSYYPPAYMMIHGGAEYVGDAVPNIEWTVQK